MLEYVAKFTELARFGGDYMATNMAKVRKFEDGLKLSIRGNIVGFLLQDGQDEYDHRKRGRRCTKHPRCEC